MEDFDERMHDECAWVSFCLFVVFFLCGSAGFYKTYLLRGFSVGVPNTFAGGTNLGKAIVIR